MSNDNIPPRSAEFSAADLTREELEAVVSKARALTRLTADFLFLEGHRAAHGREASANPFQAMATLQALDGHLLEMETLLGLDAPKRGTEPR